MSEDSFERLLTAAATGWIGRPSAEFEQWGERMAKSDIFATLFHEAWVDKQTTTSTWGPPLAIPYGLMTIGMTLLCLQLAVQVVVDLGRVGRSTGRTPR